MRSINPADMEDIAIGAAVLGTGGGGDPYIGKLMAVEAMGRRGPVQLISPEELDDEDLIICSAGMGAPTVCVEKLPSGEEIVNAFRALEKFLGKKARAVMSMEAGGLNSTIPFLPAAELGIPLVDADGMGRAFPELQMLTLTIYDIPACPLTLADERGNTVIYNAISNHWVERLARANCIDVGCVAYLGMYPLTGKQLKEAAIADTITLCQRIGESIRQARNVKQDPVAAVLETTGGLRLFRGKVIDVSRRTVSGFARGEAVLEGLDADKGERCTVEFQNEHLVAKVGDRVLCSVPDLICMLDPDTGEPITTEALRYGFRVQVIGIPCDWRWRLPRGLELVGPRYFGYDFDYVPVEQR